MGLQNKDDDDDLSEFDGPEDTEAEAQTDDDGGEDTEEVDESADEPPRPARSERRAARSSARFEERVATRVAEVTQSYQQQLTEMQRQFLQFAMRPQGEQQQKPQSSPVDDKIELSRVRQRQIESEYNALPVEQQRARFSEFEKRLQDEKDNEIDLRLEKKELQRRAQQPPTTPQTEAQQAFFTHIRGKYADVFSSPQAHAMADAKWKMALAQGKAGTHALMEQCLEEARSEMLGGGRARRSPPPSKAEKARLSGSPAGSRGPGGGNAPPTVTKAEARMAQARYPDLDEKQAVARWYKEIKSKRREEA